MAQLVRLTTHAMACRWEVALADDSAEHRLRAVGEQAFDELHRLERLLSAFNPASRVSHLNSAAHRHPVRVEAELFALLQRCQAWCAATDGCFDPTLGPLLHAWGLRGEPAPPDPATIEAARAVSGMDHVRLDADSRTVTFDTPGVQLDLGAVGKGYAADSAAEVLRECGVRRALLHGGTSTVIAVGSPPGHDDWPVAIAAPPPDAGAVAQIGLSDGALGVSSPSGRVIERAGRRIGHVLDPRSGEPVEGHALAAAACPSAADADVWSTALLVGGAELLERFRAHQPEGAAFVVARGGRSWSVGDWRRPD